MYLIDIKVKPSQIEGQGVFAEADIRKDSLVWKFNPNHDKTMSVSEFNKLDGDSKMIIEKIGYISDHSKEWVFPPENDPARFTNHSRINNLSVLMDKTISIEPVFIANRDIKKGEELTVNYNEFDSRELNNKPDWL